MIYVLFRRRGKQELDAGSDLRARQYAMADPGVDRVETADGRVVYRKVKLPDIDLSIFHNQKEA